MIEIKPMDRSHYEDMHKLCQEIEPFRGYNPFDLFCAGLDCRRGFTFWNKDRLMGYATYSDYVPGHTVCIHLTCRPNVMNRRLIKHIFKFGFETLHTYRMFTFIVDGLTDGARKFIERLGFVKEGNLREAARMDNGEIRDMHLYGLLRKECGKWI